MRESNLLLSVGCRVRKACCPLSFSGVNFVYRWQFMNVFTFRARDFFFLEWVVNVFCSLCSHHIHISPECWHVTVCVHKIYRKQLHYKMLHPVKMLMTIRKMSRREILTPVQEWELTAFSLGQAGPEEKQHNYFLCPHRCTSDINSINMELTSLAPCRWMMY